MQYTLVDLLHVCLKEPLESLYSKHLNPGGSVLHFPHSFMPSPLLTLSVMHTMFVQTHAHTHTYLEKDYFIVRSATVQYVVILLQSFFIFYFVLFICRLVISAYLLEESFNPL